MVHSISYLYYMINFLHLKHPQDIVSWSELLVKDWVLYVLGKRVGGVILPQIKVLSTTLSYTILNNSFTTK